MKLSKNYNEHRSRRETRLVSQKIIGHQARQQYRDGRVADLGVKTQNAAHLVIIGEQRQKSPAGRDRLENISLSCLTWNVNAREVK